MPYQYIKFCGSCALRTDNINSPTGHICSISNLIVDASKDFCSKHKNELPTCDVCGQATLDLLQIIKTKEGDFIAMCGECSKQLGHCRTCIHGNKCSFETDPSSLPKIVNKEITQGNARFVTQIKNPDRVRQTCQKNCPCFSSDNLCLKQSVQTCQQYRLAHRG